MCNDDQIHINKKNCLEKKIDEDNFFPDIFQKFHEKNAALKDENE